MKENFPYSSITYFYLFVILLISINHIYVTKSAYSWSQLHYKEITLEYYEHTNCTGQILRIDIFFQEETLSKSANFILNCSDDRNGCEYQRYWIYPDDPRESVFFNLTYGECYDGMLAIRDSKANYLEKDYCVFIEYPLNVCEVRPLMVRASRKGVCAFNNYHECGFGIFRASFCTNLTYDEFDWNTRITYACYKDYGVVNYSYTVGNFDYLRFPPDPRTLKGYANKPSVPTYIDGGANWSTPNCDLNTGFCSMSTADCNCLYNNCTSQIKIGECVNGVRIDYESIDYIEEEYCIFSEGMGADVCENLRADGVTIFRKNRCIHDIKVDCGVDSVSIYDCSGNLIVSLARWECFLFSVDENGVSYGLLPGDYDYFDKKRPSNSFPMKNNSCLLIFQQFFCIFILWLLFKSK
eukprot:gene2035-2504_t